ncbi:hypothetical protein KFU94_03545 [Chloroflexi bacterium TSY]|nr:hypothetical protein [Chloroflexi bacterium TSY]
MHIHNILNKMQTAETDFLQTEFMAPILPNGQVRVRIAGLVSALKVVGEPTARWAILKPLNMQQAHIVGKPSLRQIQDYLALFPAVRLLLIEKDDDAWSALPAFQADERFEFRGRICVQLVQSAQPFQRILARFDGTNFWFQEVDRRRNPAIATYLRDALTRQLAPKNLHKPTLTREERNAYRVVYQARKRAKRDKADDRLADAVAHADAKLVSYLEHDDAYSGTFNVDGRRHHTAVNKTDFSLLSAGICLSGEDHKFDLQSLVGVIREGEKSGHLYFE